MGISQLNDVELTFSMTGSAYDDLKAQANDGQTWGITYGIILEFLMERNAEISSGSAPYSIVLDLCEYARGLEKKIKDNK